MADDEFPREDELAGRQDDALYPVGRTLRQTFDAENHDSLGDDLTGLMLQLAQVDDDDPVPRVVLPTLSSVTPSPDPPPAALRAPATTQPSWGQRMLEWLRAR